MDRIVFESTKLPRWLRVAFVDEDGQVFLPCGAFGNETLAMLCLGADGVPFVRDGKHIYAPASWLAELHPRLAEAIQTVASNVTRRLAALVTPGATP